MDVHRESGRRNNGNVINGSYIGEVSAHENGHAFGLNHQSDYTGNTLVNEYSLGDANPGNGTYVPIIGQADGRQRVAWRLGDSDVNGTRTFTNDIQKMLATDTAANATSAGRTGGVDLHFVNDGIGHSRALATPLPLNGSAINFNAAQGVIVPTSEANPNPIGAANYTQDWFSFTSSGSAITLTANDGSEFLTGGIADGGATLRSTLGIYNSAGTLVASGTEDASTLYETYNGTLAAGTYYADIASFGGHVQNSPSYNAASYYDTGAFFLTGTGFSAVPEPTSIGLISIAACGFLARRRRA